MLGIQRSPVAYNLQHLREYNSCRIWASQSRRPPYVADVEGRARIEGVAASIHESYTDAHGNKVAEDAVFKSPCVVIIFDEAPRYREVQSKPGSKHPIMKAYRDRASRQAETREETRPRTRSAVARQGRSWQFKFIKEFMSVQTITIDCACDLLLTGVNEILIHGHTHAYILYFRISDCS